MADTEKTILIKYRPGAPKLEKTEKGDWIDLYTYEDVTLHAGDYAQIPLGVMMKLPDSYEANVAPRSSTFRRWGVLQTNSVSVIDNSYCGDDDEWLYPVYATRDITIPRGTRLCQFRINKVQPPIEFQEVQQLNHDSRGGLGSTGV